MFAKSAFEFTNDRRRGCIIAFSLYDINYILYTLCAKTWRAVCVSSATDLRTKRKSANPRRSRYSYDIIIIYLPSIFLNSLCFYCAYYYTRHTFSARFDNTGNLICIFFVLQTMQILEEEKSKLDNFCEQSLKNVSVARVESRRTNVII